MSHVLLLLMIMVSPGYVAMQYLHVSIFRIWYYFTQLLQFILIVSDELPTVLFCTTVNDSQLSFMIQIEL